MKTTDRRILRTEKLITDALLNLLMEKKFNDITIQEITDTANVGRATFYLHYANKEECLLQLLTKGFDSLVDEMETNLTNPNRDLNEVIEQIFNHTVKNRKLYRALLGDSQSAILLNDIKNYIKSKILENNTMKLNLYPFAGWQ